MGDQSDAEEEVGILIAVKVIFAIPISGSITYCFFARMLPSSLFPMLYLDPLVGHISALHYLS